jgi:hypothetical protein
MVTARKIRFQAMLRYGSARSARSWDQCAMRHAADSWRSRNVAGI